MPRKPGTSGSEGGRSKRTRSPGTSSAAYPTSCPRSIGAAGRAEASANAEPAAYLTTVPVMPDQRHSSQLRVADLDPGRIATTVKLGADPQARSGPGRAGQVHDRLVAHQRRPRQFIEIWENSRCSIRFHFDVPGGKWHTVTARPVSAASLPSSTFHSRLR